MASLLEIPYDVADIWDDYHFLLRLSLLLRTHFFTVATTKREPLSSLVVLRANKFHGIDFSLELTNMSKQKHCVITVNRKLVRLDSGEITQDKWSKLRVSSEFQPMVDRQVRDTRQTV